VDVKFISPWAKKMMFGRIFLTLLFFFHDLSMVILFVEVKKMKKMEKKEMERK
jgi:hypothetical protein